MDPQVTEVDYAKKPLAKADVERIVDMAGSVAAVLNVYHATAKERGWKERPPTKASFVAAVLEQPNLLRRPILVAGKTIVVGKNLTAVRAALA